MGYLVNTMNSAYLLLNYGAHKNVCYLDGQKVQKIYTKFLPYLKNKTLGSKCYALMVFTEGYKG
jgi:hypothetical protein